MLNQSNRYNKSTLYIEENEKCDTCDQKLWGCFQDYSSNTSVHGVQYLGEDNRPYYERIFWIIIFVISVYGCSKMIYSEWKKWDETPVIVSFDEKETDIWKIPFPAITICPESKIDLDLYNNETIKPFKSVLTHICDKTLLNWEDEVTNSTENFEPFAMLEKISPKLIFVCKWRNKLLNCDDILTKILTEDGICYNFNGLSNEDLFHENRVPKTSKSVKNHNLKSTWNREDGYEKLQGAYSYPKHATGYGKHRGLEITIYKYTANKEEKQDLAKGIFCRDMLGYKVLIHSPDNIPRIQSRHFYLPFNKKVIASIKPSMTYTSEGLRPYPPNKRNCVFKDEVKLNYFKPYTQINCETECVINYTLKKCNCVRFSMPSQPRIRICETKQDFDCYNEAENDLLENEWLDLNKTTHSKTNCKCLPACTTIEYNVEVSNSDLILPIIFFKEIIINNQYFSFSFLNKWVNRFAESASQNSATDNKASILTNFTKTQLTLFFKEDSFISSKRSELYGLSSFFSSCGGLLGLFMGVSVLSFIEIFYFAVIRPTTNHCKMPKYEITSQDDN